MKKPFYYSLLFWTLLALLGGGIVGTALGKSANDLGQVAAFVIDGIKLFAMPLLFFTITTAVLETEIPKKMAAKLVGVSGINAVCSILIAWSLFSGFKSSFSMPVDWVNLPSPDFVSRVPKWEMGAWLAKNQILLIAIIAVLLGISIRRMGQAQKFHKPLQRGLLLSQKVLKAWTYAIPLAVFSAIAKSIGNYGFSPFSRLSVFAFSCLLGFALQVFVVYQFWIFKRARVPLSEFWKKTLPTLGTAFGTNSSLATLPLTLKTLAQIKVSKSAASLGAGVATNLNNDGILLYEAYAALFITALMGQDLSFTQALPIFMYSWIGAVGIAGVPEAGLVSLAMVLSATSLPTEHLPLLLTVDWLLARCRSVVNVVSDMTLSIAIDAPHAGQPPADAHQ